MAMPPEQGRCQTQIWWSRGEGAMPLDGGYRHVLKQEGGGRQRDTTRHREGFQTGKGLRMEGRTCSMPFNSCLAKRCEALLGSPSPLYIL